MPRASPKKMQRYGVAFKRTAVQLSRRPGIQVQAVAEALDIHPFMLSRWRKEFREGRLRLSSGARTRRRRKVRWCARFGGYKSWNGRITSCRRSMRS